MKWSVKRSKLIMNMKLNSLMGSSLPRMDGFDEVPLDTPKSTHKNLEGRRMSEFFVEMEVGIEMKCG